MPKKAPHGAASLLSFESTDRAPRVLLVDDDKQILEDFQRAFLAPPIHKNETRFEVLTESDPEDVLSYIDEDNIDIFVVDLKLKARGTTEEDEELGASLVKKIYDLSSAGIIVYSSQPPHRSVDFLFDGADDYIEKGAAAAIIRSRVSSLWRRIKAVRPAYAASFAHFERTFRIGIWTFVVGSREVRSAGATIRLSPLEHALLSYILTVDGHQIDREYFCAYVLGRETHDADRRIDNLVSRLRKKLGPTLQFVAERGGGYRLLGAIEVPKF